MSGSGRFIASLGRGCSFQPSIIECREDSCSAWDGFVKEARGTYCHLFGWKRVIERAYGLRTHYLAFRSAGEWLGVLPVAVMPRLPGRAPKAVSLPYCNYGGLLAAPGVDATALKTEAVKYLNGLGVVMVELRELAPGETGAGEVTMALSLPESPDMLWKQVRDKVRNQVRKARRCGLTVRWGPHQGDELYDIYAKNMGRLGTPVHSAKFVNEILACLGDHSDVLTVRHEGRAIGAMLVIKHGDTWSDPLASCLADYNSLNPNMLLYWESLRAACDAGAAWFDLGRSYKSSGTYRFKRQWGAGEIALNYHTFRNGTLMPAGSTDFYRSRHANRLAGIWRRLPAFIQRRLGPVVRRRLP